MSDQDPFAPVGGGARGGRPKAATWICVTPVPDDAPVPPAAHPSLGKPSARWIYGDAAGRLLGFACRFEEPDGGKAFRPLTLWRSANGDRLAWRWVGWPDPRPLYGLDRLAARPLAPVVIVEGEKAADAAARLLPDHVAISSPNGSKSAGKADWSPLQGRRVTIWPDADEPGAEYAAAVVSAALASGATSVRLLEPPAGVTLGWDAADAELEGMSPTQAAALVATATDARRPEPVAARADARPAERTSRRNADGEPGAERRRPAQRDELLRLVDLADLWRDENGRCYVDAPINGHRESWLIQSHAFKRWLASRAYRASGMAPGGQALDDAARVLAALAYEDGEVRTASLRVGQTGDRHYLDLADRQCRAVEIDRDGWRVVDRPGAAFVRTPQMLDLPVPEPGYELSELRSFVNVATDDDFVLLVMWIVAALRSRGPYPILVFTGEHGVGKSTISRLIRSLVDPNQAPIRAAPKDDRDLIIGAINSHVLALDNMSSVPHWLSDGLCRLATGGGFASRTLHSDSDETVLQAVRPIILNGIPSLTERPDLADRAITVRLRRIPEGERKTEERFWADWEIVRPRVLGCLLDGFSVGLARVSSVQIDRLPRMADFAIWSAACELGLGFESGSFIEAYRANADNTAETTFEADPVAVAIRDMVRGEYPQGWNGSATELLAAINLRVSEGTKRLKLWPQTSNSLGARIDRIAPLLRSQGFTVERRHSGTRTILIAPVGA